MGIKWLPRMLCTHNWGMLEPPDKIGQSHSFPFAFSEQLSFLLPPTRAGLMDPALGGQGEGRRVTREITWHFRTGHLPPACLLEKASPRLTPCNCCWLLLREKLPFPLCCACPGAGSWAAFECLLSAACSGCIDDTAGIWNTNVIEVREAQQAHAQSSQEKTALTAPFYASRQYLARKLLLTGSIHSLSWKKLADVSV